MIHAARRQGFTVGAKGDCRHSQQQGGRSLRPVSFESEDFSACFYAPESRAFIISGQNYTAVRREGDGDNSAACRMKDADQLAGFQVPQADRSVDATGDEGLPVRRKGDGGNSVGVSLVNHDQTAGSDFDQFNGCISPCRQQH